MKWEPIETAPKDGRVILGWRFYPVVIKWTGDKTFPWEAIQLGSMPFFSNAFCDGDQSLTHWMPLPEPPNR
jgi:hypothetical protein